MISEAKRAVILIVEDELLIRMNAVEMIEEAVLKSSKRQVRMKPLQFLKGAWTSPSYSPISKCPEVWMVSSLLLRFGDRWPPIKIVATSGHVKLGPGDLPEGGRFLPKPYSPAEIMKTLGELIAA